MFIQKQALQTTKASLHPVSNTPATTGRFLRTLAEVSKGFHGLLLCKMPTVSLASKESKEDPPKQQAIIPPR